MPIPWCEAPPPRIDDLLAAQTRLAGAVHHTPVITSRRLDQTTGAELFFKCENLQRSGAFKARGAFNTVLSLGDGEARRGVATHSSGNHGAALAMAAASRGIPAYVVVPRTAARVKRAAIEREGARIVDCDPTLSAREETLAAVVAETGARYVPPFDDPRVIAGQGTAALELLDAVPGLTQVWVPVGGGGLASGTAIAVASRAPDTAVIAAEPANADDAWRSLQCGERQPMEAPDTIADGLRTALSPLTFGILRDAGVKVVLASEKGIRSAQVHLMEELKVIVEPSAAVPLAAMLEQPETATGQRIGVVLTGGNADLDWQAAVGRS